MLKLIFYFSFVIYFTTYCNFFTAQNIKEVNSKIKDVTVFLNSAEIKRIANIVVNKGSNEIKLTQLSPYIQPNSIQVKADNKNITIVSVNSQVNYLDREKLNKSPEVKSINDSIEELSLKLQIRESYERVYKEEKSLLLANKKIGGENTGVDIEDLMDIADFYRDRLANIETKLLDIKRDKKKLNDAINRLNKQRSLYYNNVKNTGEILINITSLQKTNAKIEVVFVSSNAGWEPFYDIRSNNIKEPIELVYKGKVHQKTGNDWNNVNIKLSTGNPSSNNTQPKFSKWYLQYYTPINTYQRPQATMKREAYSLDEAQAPSFDDIESSKSIADFTTVKESTVNTTFDISIPYTIKSNGKPNLIEIQNYEMPVSYKYYTIPRKDNDAFLLANIVGWGDYNLLPGNTNIYFENTFVGESYLATSTTNDTLNVSMGRDKSIIITREKIKDFSKNNTFGNNKKSTRGYELKIRNNKSQQIEIEVIDQIPLSTKKEIEVELLESKGAKYNASSGKLTWILKIPANTTETISYKFSVKYPKDKNISNL